MSRANETAEDALATHAPGHSVMRYQVLAAGLAFAAITYLDRVCISRAAPQIQRDLGLSDIQMGWVFSAFIWAYALFEIPTGMWCDRIGPRRVMTRIVIWWSSFTMATAAAFNYASIVFARFLFGAGEAGAWPTMTNTLARWFPTTERGTAQGMIFMGAHLAGGLTPMLVGLLLQSMHWRAVFVLFGVIGFLWSAFWYLWFRDDPAEHPGVSESERKYILGGRGQIQGHRIDLDSLAILARSRGMWALCIMYFTQAYGFYFYITWLPTYLIKVRGFGSSGWLGLLSGLPLILSAVGDVLGGLTTDFVVRRWGLRAGRCGVGGASLLVAGIAMLIGATTSHPLLSAIMIGLAGAAANFLLGSCWGVCVDVAGGHAGLISACMNSAGQVGGAICPLVIATFVQKSNDWTTPLVLIGVLYLLGSASWWLVDPARPVFAERQAD